MHTYDLHLKLKFPPNIISKFYKFEPSPCPNPCSQKQLTSTFPLEPNTTRHNSLEHTSPINPMVVSQIPETTYTLSTYILERTAGLISHQGNDFVTNIQHPLVDDDEEARSFDEKYGDLGEFVRRGSSLSGSIIGVGT